jgi:gamma-glutamylcyclotransferase (GGCT)/AIG2-like uncharacterized protein YtfP
MSNNIPLNPLTEYNPQQQPSKTSHIVFVYGTLRRNHYNHQLISNAAFLDVWVTPANYTMVSFGFYPAVIHAGATPISGELYQVDDTLLEEMDRLEGIPHLYQRHAIDTPVGRAYWYMMSQSTDHAEVVSSGDWDEHISSGVASNV